MSARQYLPVAVLLLVIGKTAVADSSRVSRAAWVADIDLLERAYTQLHPGLYRYNTPAQMRARFAALRDSVESDISLESAFLALSKLTASIKCGHTYPNFY